MAEDGKVSLSLNFARPAQKAKPKVSLQHEEQKEQRDYIGTVSGRKLESLAPKVEAPKPVIPSLPNTFETGRGKRQRGVPSFVPEPTNNELGAGAERFENAVMDEVAQVGSITYGLNKRLKPDSKPGDEEEAPRERSFVERAMEKKMMSREELELQQLKEDVEELPEESTLDDYEAMPIENFGEAMLRGMGWEEGKGIKGREPVKPIEYIARPRGLGLGAKAALEQPSATRILRQGETRDPKDQMALPVGPDGRIRSVRTVDEKLVKVERAGVYVGKRMVIVDGRHAGLHGEVRAVEKREGRSDRATVRLDLNEMDVTVRASELADVNSQQAEEAVRRAGGGGAGPSSRDKDRDTDRDRDREKGSRREEEKKEAPRWLTPSIRVRCVSKSVGGGKFYLVKGTICDVLTPHECIVQFDGGKIVEGVADRQLETVVPKGSGRIAVVGGRLKGQRGKMVAKVDGGEAASVQLTSDFSMHTLPLDLIAEYVGPLDECD